MEGERQGYVLHIYSPIDRPLLVSLGKIIGMAAADMHEQFGEFGRKMVIGGIGKPLYDEIVKKKFDYGMPVVYDPSKFDEITILLDRKVKVESKRILPQFGGFQYTMEREEEPIITIQIREI